MKTIHCLILISFAALLGYAVVSLPPRGLASAPLHRERSPAGTPVAAYHYVAHARQDAATPNVVTVILADYRGFDTLGETLVVFTAGMACYLILRKKE